MRIHFVLALLALVACKDKDTGVGMSETLDGDTGEDTAADTDTETGEETGDDTAQDTETGEETGGETGEETGGDSDTGEDTSPPVDADGDGSFSDVDCDDANGNVHPGAVELCNDLDDDCDAGTNEAGTASVVANDGTWTDVSAALASGTAADPAIIGDDATYDVHVTGGEVRVCAGTWYAKVVFVEETARVEIIAPDGPFVTTLTTDGTSGGAPGSIVAITNANVSLEGFTIEGGAGSESTTGSYQGGGVIVAHTSGTSAPAEPNLTLTDCVVTGNEAGYGGGLALRSYGWISLVDTRIEGNVGTSAGGGVWVQTEGTLTCSASSLGAAGFSDNVSPIGGAMYLSDQTNGVVDAVGCDWGDDAAGDDNAEYDIQQNPASDIHYCYPNATSLSDSVSCVDGDCTASTDASCP